MPRTSQNDHHQPEKVQASFLLCATTGARVFTNSCISQALYASDLGKYLLEGKNGSALVVTLTTPGTIEHFLLHCPLFHSHHSALCSQLSTLGITTLDLPTLLVA
ncbi:hypothetical protein E2C01_027433 [Portunus trituberculatus]|uniref:Uncharacterized protein n=1 Tax=Portunus trituberculatus TaxID=210409 RepID=A0A5B7EI46_PORTR|nr:hypothetical protein [Portunus trituberculatus]